MIVNNLKMSYHTQTWVKYCNIQNSKYQEEMDPTFYTHWVADVKNLQDNKVQ